MGKQFKALPENEKAAALKELALAFPGQKGAGGPPGRAGECAGHLDQ